MPSLQLPDRVRLAKILGLLGSDQAGERDNAAIAAAKFVRDHDTTFADVLLSPPAPSPTRSRPAQTAATGWRALARNCAARLDELNPWQSNFINSVLGLKSLTPRQLGKLREIAIELGLEDSQ